MSRTRQCAATQARGIPLRLGHFPGALSEHERFDVIVFNDVFEHIPDARGVLTAGWERLEVGGLLVLNLPSSKGMFRRTSKLARRLGIASFFSRMWQEGFPSPHVHYFHADNLEKLVSGGFTLVHRGSLASVSLDGPRERIQLSQGGKSFAGTLTYRCLRAAYPFLRLLPADITLAVFRREPSPPESAAGPAGAPVPYPAVR